MKNDYANSNLKVNGRFQEYDAGMRFQPFETEYKLGWFTLSPRLFATVGYRYTDWKLNDVAIDITGVNTQFNAADFSMTSKVSYFGVGYAF